MKTSVAIASLSLMSILSFGALAAQSINNSQASNMQSIGTITLNGVTDAPSDIAKAVSDKATQQGATAYRIVEARNSDNWHVTAELYK